VSGDDGARRARLRRRHGAASASLPDANAVAVLGPFANRGAGGFRLADATPLAVTGAVAAGSGDLTLDAAGNLGLAANLAAGNAVSLNAGGSIRQTAGTVAAQSLTGSATGGASLTDANTIAVLGPFTNRGAGGFSLTDTAPLAVVGTVAAGTGNLTLNVAGNLGLAADLGAATGVVTLNASGTVNQMAGTIDAMTLTGRARGGTSLADANAIAALGPFTNGGAGGFSLVDTRPLEVVGAVAAGSGNLSLSVGGALGLAADLSAGGGVTLNAAGTITQSGGAIAAGTLTGTSNGDASLTDPGNAIAVLGNFATNGGSFLLVDGATLAVAGNVNAGRGAVLLQSTGGAVTETTGRVTANAVILRAATGIELKGANQIETLAAQASQGIAVNDALPLTVGTVTASSTVFADRLADVATTAGDVALRGTGGLTLAGNVTATSGNVFLEATGGALTAPGGTVTLGGSLLSLDAGGTIGTVAIPVRVVDNAAALTLAARAGGDVQLAVTSPSLTIGTVAPPAFLTGPLQGIAAGGAIGISSLGAVELAASLTAGRDIVLTSGGAITADGSQSLATPGIIKLNAASFTLRGTTTVAAPVLAMVNRPGSGGAAIPDGLATLADVSQLPPGGPGAVSLGALNAPGTVLLLSVGSGAVTGTIDVRGLAIRGGGGSAVLFGTLGGIGGQFAAETGHVLPEPDNAYRLNNCAIGSPNCTVLPILVPLAPQVVNSIQLLEQRAPADPLDIDRVNTGNEDQL
jgi:hypothetical protein